MDLINDPSFPSTTRLWFGTRLWRVSIDALDLTSICEDINSPSRTLRRVLHRLSSHTLDRFRNTKHRIRPRKDVSKHRRSSLTGSTNGVRAAYDRSFEYRIGSRPIWLSIGNLDSHLVCCFWRGFALHSLHCICLELSTGSTHDVSTLLQSTFISIIIIHNGVAIGLFAWVGGSKVASKAS